MLLLMPCWYPHSGEDAAVWTTRPQCASAAGVGEFTQSWSVAPRLQCTLSTEGVLPDILPCWCLQRRSGCKQPAEIVEHETLLIGERVQTLAHPCVSLCDPRPTRERRWMTQTGKQEPWMDMIVVWHTETAFASLSLGGPWLVVVVGTQERIKSRLWHTTMHVWNVSLFLDVWRFWFRLGGARSFGGGHI